ncbi:DNA polymerase Y family protein [Pseudonocardia sp. GCM10023141]|uniref:DNA polymerase Y family protein n=1 Tax=Pseudonocardia sp. GCM10023141 TaxID=3252653 RepID=UPI00360600A2
MSEGTSGAGPVRVLALWLPDWPVTAAAAAAHVPAEQPAAVIGANRVLACSAVARAQGVRRGLRRREAQARCPDLAVLAPDADRDARAFEPVVVAVEELAPGVEVVRPGLVALPARGPAGYFGGELRAAERLVDQVAARTGAESQVGVADGLFAAVIAARRGVAVGPGDTRAFLSGLEVEELDREPGVDRSELIGLLRRLGLRSLGAFGGLDAQDVASRFGADAVLAHRLARGLDPRPPVRRHPPEELTAEVELDPPVDRVDAAAFAARGLAERLHRTLAGHGLSCTRLGVGARTVSGEVLYRIWRCAEPLTPAGTVDRVRWQLDAWLTARSRSTATAGGPGAVALLWLVPEETVAAGALQLGLWGEIGEADERAGRALVRVQALLGPESVVTAVLVGGRDPAERVRLVPWGDDRGDREVAPAANPVRRPRVVKAAKGTDGALADVALVSTKPVAPAGWPDDVLAATGRISAADPMAPGRGPSTNRRRRVPAPRRSPRPAMDHEPPPPWPGRLPAPSPATVPPQPLPAQLLDAAGEPVRLTAPDLLSAPPRSVVVDDGEPGTVTGWAGPWPLQQRWWAPGADAAGSRLQVLTNDAAAMLMISRQGRWWVTGIYD